MRIDKADMYHGAAVMQIAQYAPCTVKRGQLDGRTWRSALRINGKTAVYLKYAVKPNGLLEYVFTFSDRNIHELATLGKKVESVFIILTCIDGREICCLRLDEFEELLERRQRAAGHEASLSVLVTLPRRKEFRVYVNAPGRRNRRLGDPLLVPRNCFPSRLFAPIV